MKKRNMGNDNGVNISTSLLAAQGILIAESLIALIALCVRNV